MTRRWRDNLNLTRLFQHPRGLQDLTPNQLATKLGDVPPVTLIDVRTPREYKSGHIPGAVTIPLGKEHTVVGTWDTTTDIILICKTGHRSQAAAATLLNLGYSHISHLKGGMDAWRREGNPVEK